MTDNIFFSHHALIFGFFMTRTCRTHDIMSCSEVMQQRYTGNGTRFHSTGSDLHDKPSHFSFLRRSNYHFLIFVKYPHTSIPSQQAYSFLYTIFNRTAVNDIEPYLHSFSFSLLSSLNLESL